MATERRRTGIHWPALDYDLSFEGIIAGRKKHPNALPFTREVRAKNQALKSSVRRGKPP
jgi:hypothetical protein